MANKGLYDTVLYLLENSETASDFSYKIPENSKFKPGETRSHSIVEEIEQIAITTKWDRSIDIIQIKTYPYYIKTIELLKSRGVELDLPEDLSSILDLNPAVSHYVTPTYSVENGENVITSIKVSDEITETNLPDDHTQYSFDENNKIQFNGEVKYNRKRYFDI